MPVNRQDDGEDQPAGQQRKRQPLPAAQRHGLAARALALDRHILVGGLEQPALYHHQRHGHHHQADGDGGHQVVRRRTELVGQLVQIGRQHQVAFRIAQHQHQAEHFEAEEEHQHAGIRQRRHDHRQRHIQHHLDRRGAGHAGRFLDVRTQAFQRRRGIQVDVRHVRQAGDDDDAGEGIDIPGHEAEQLLGPDRVKAHRPHRHHVAKAHHHRRDEDRHQQHAARPSRGPADRCAPSRRPACRPAARRSRSGRRPASGHS